MQVTPRLARPDDFCLLKEVEMRVAQDLGEDVVPVPECLARSDNDTHCTSLRDGAVLRDLFGAARTFFERMASRTAGAMPRMSA